MWNFSFQLLIWVYKYRPSGKLSSNRRDSENKSVAQGSIGSKVKAKEERLSVEDVVPMATIEGRTRNVCSFRSMSIVQNANCILLFHSLLNVLSFCLVTVQKYNQMENLRRDWASPPPYLSTLSSHSLIVVKIVVTPITWVLTSPLGFLCSLLV